MLMSFIHGGTFTQKALKVGVKLRCLKTKGVVMYYFTTPFENVCGETGIRTLGPLKGINGFRDRPIRPLWHLSGWGVQK